MGIFLPTHLTPLSKQLDNLCTYFVSVTIPRTFIQLTQKDVNRPPIITKEIEKYKNIVMDDTNWYHNIIVVGGGISDKLSNLVRIFVALHNT